MIGFYFILGYLAAVVSLVVIRKKREILPAWVEHLIGEKPALKLADCTPEANRRWIDAALKAMQCKAEWMKSEEGSWNGHFVYQSGHFRVFIPSDSNYVRLFFPFFYECNPDDLDIVQQLCNQVTQRSDNEQLVYTIDDESGMVNLHISTNLLVGGFDTRQVLEQAMARIFHWRLQTTGNFSLLREKKLRNMDYNDEWSTALNTHHLYLLREFEMFNDKVSMNLLPALPQRLDTLLAQVLGLRDIVPVRLAMKCGDEQRIIDEPDDILGWDFVSTIIRDGSFIDSSATLRLSYYDPRRPKFLRSVVLSLDADGQTDDKLYLRASLMRVPLNIDLDIKEELPEAEPMAVSTLIGYNLDSEKQLDGEFVYRYKEAMAKLKAEGREALDDDEKLLADLADNNIGRWVFKGRAYFMNKRYYEATLMFECAIRAQQRMAEGAQLTADGPLHRLYYYMGFSLCRLQQWERAYFYLDSILFLKQIPYTEAFINCAIHLDTERTLHFISMALNEMQQPNDEGEMKAERYPDFVRFLKRRRVQAMMMVGQWKEAEQVLNLMLKDPAESDFALGELSHLKRLQSRKTATSTSSPVDEEPANNDADNNRPSTNQ